MNTPTMPHKHILLVEDDPAIAEPLHYALSREGWDVAWHTTAQAALHALDQQRFDFLILDVGLPDLNGFDLCRQIRQHHTTPLLFLTARNDEIDRIIGLEIGADDYCAKPFSPREIISRIKVIWRRMESTLPPLPTEPVQAPQPLPDPTSVSLSWGVWHYDDARCQVHYHGQPLPLTRYELRLLEALLRNPERVLSRAQLMAQAWQHPDHSLERTIDSHIKTLRQKLRAVHPTDPIVTHRGLGYRLSR
jgi:two-component system catabolic regulation response regulator CreB